jgi:4-hydroxy 2-oxovalerate aldolase
MYPVRLLDATLRDGSYCVDFQFTAADTAVLVGMLDAAGVGFIELGHGSGTFNHKAPPNFRSKMRQAATDEEYLEVARACAPRAKLGVITGPFGTDDLGVLAAHRIDFVRLACMADRALEPANLEMARRAKALGLTFSFNLMQTTAITPARVREIARELANAGVDWLYIVDSSGGLMPSAVREYVEHARDAGITIGFHAHHNSGLAVANCLVAIEAGATMVDGTLQGLGRDVGNAPTEQLLFMLQRLGHERAIDVEQLCHAGDLTRALLLDKGQDPTYIASGVSEIHSTNVQPLVELARERGLGARSLLAAVARGDVKLIGAGMKTFPEDVLGPACAIATKATAVEPRAEVVDVVAKDIARASSRSLPALADVLYARAAKHHTRSVLHLVPAELMPFAGPLPWEHAGLSGITLGVTAAELASVDFGDRTPETIVVDPAFAGAFPSPIVDAFLPVVVDSALALGSVCRPSSGRVWLVCATPAFATALTARASGMEVVGSDDPSWLDRVAAADTLILVGHKVVPAQLAGARARAARTLRPALATGIAARIATLIDLRTRLARAEGALVDPIFVPAEGEVVVDDPACPSTVVEGSDLHAAATARSRTLARGAGRL